MSSCFVRLCYRFGPFVSSGPEVDAPPPQPNLDDDEPEG
jgi:hypothetical protein